MSTKPSPDAIAEALAEIELCHTRTPPVSTLRVLQDAGITPTLEIGETVILEWDITDGAPMNGALRSDDHVSSWKTAFRSMRESCPDCDAAWREYEYHSHHNIAGRVSEVCQICGHEFESEEWG